MLRWSPEALAKLEGYDWPGNVRQLKNVVQRALLFRGEGPVVPASAVTFEDTRVTPADGGDDDTLYVRGLTLEGIEGKLFRPMALTLIFALGWSLLVAFLLKGVRGTAVFFAIEVFADKAFNIAVEN